MCFTYIKLLFIFSWSFYDVLLTLTGWGESNRLRAKVRKRRKLRKGAKKKGLCKENSNKKKALSLESEAKKNNNNESQLKGSQSTQGTLATQLNEKVKNMYDRKKSLLEFVF